MRGQSGEIDLSSGAPKHEAKALGVIIENQNVLHSPALSRTCWWQLHRLLNDTESFRLRANLTTKRKKAKRILQTIFGRQSKDRRVECSGPVMKGPFFHSLRYSRPSHHGHGAFVRFFRATCENIFTTSFEVDQSSADEYGLDDRYGCQANFFSGAPPATTEARGGRTKTGSRIEIAITTAMTCSAPA